MAHPVLTRWHAKCHSPLPSQPAPCLANGHFDSQQSNHSLMQHVIVEIARRSRNHD